MEEFNTLEKVTELFKNAGCEGTENCYFLALKDNARAQSGVVGGMEYPYWGLLINETENGLGIFYLNLDKFTFKFKLEDVKIMPNSYFFIPNENIKKITVKNYSIFNTKAKSITIKTNDGKTHHLSVKLDQNILPYQNDNITKFIEKHSNR